MKERWQSHSVQSELHLQSLHGGKEWTAHEPLKGLIVARAW